MPYLEAKFSLYIAGEGPYPMVYHRETSETDPKKTVEVVYFDVPENSEFADYADEFEDLHVDDLPDGFVEKVGREIDNNVDTAAFIFIDERFSDEDAGINDIPASGTFFYMRIDTITQALTDAEKERAIRGAAFSAMYPDEAAKLDEATQGRSAKGSHSLLKYFTTEHLPEDLRPIGNVFVAVAEALDGLVPGGPEQTVALRKLLESKDAAVRAVKYPGN